MAIESYRDLDVWKVAMTLAQESYLLVARAAVSIPASIAEGYGRDRTASFVQFLRIAQGSARELETHLILAERIALVDQEAVAPLQELCERVSKMLRSLIRSLEARRANKE